MAKSSVLKMIYIRANKAGCNHLLHAQVAKTLARPAWPLIWRSRINLGWRNGMALAMKSMIISDFQVLRARLGLIRKGQSRLGSLFKIWSLMLSLTTDNSLIRSNRNLHHAGTEKEHKNEKAFFRIAKIKSGFYRHKVLHNPERYAFDGMKLQGCHQRRTLILGISSLTESEIGSSWGQRDNKWVWAGCWITWWASTLWPSFVERTTSVNFFDVSASDKVSVKCDQEEQRNICVVIAMDNHQNGFIGNNFGVNCHESERNLKNCWTFL